MKVSIDKSELRGELYAPPSKSYTHRAISIGSLSSQSIIHRPLLSADTEATIRACEMFGATIEKKNNDLVIKGVDGAPEVPDDVIDVANSGTTLRFMTTIATLTDGVTVLTGDHSVRTRPNGPLLDVLHSLGVEAYSTRNNGRAPLIVRGGLKGAITKIDGSISSQFVSALLIACPLTNNSTTLSIKGELKSKPYVDITIEIIEKAGCEIFVDKNHNTKFIIPAKQKYNLKEYTVPGDFSSASYLLAAAVMTGSKITVKNLFPSRQGDIKIIDILDQMGANINWDKEKGDVTVNGGDMKGITVDLGDSPDLFPTIAVLGAAAKGTTVITNAEHVRYKETDRIHAMANELQKMGIKVKEEKDKLTVNGGHLVGTDVHGWHDHRIVMALTIAGLVVGDTTIDTAESVFISYPNFFEEMRKIGAGVIVVEE